MDSPNNNNTHEITALSPCNSGRRRTSRDSNSPEFEFWMVRNPSFPQPNLLSADELFVDGVLLPLHLLPNKSSHPDPGPSDKESGEEEEAEAGPELRRVTAGLTNGLTSSKRWKDIFKRSDKKNVINTKNVEDKEKRRDKKCQGGAGSAELNINIWPFSRSRSAGNSGTRPRMVSGAPSTRKVSSAPCSRSNSAGESKSRKWPSSPGRAGVHLGRSSPIWQVKRGAGAGGGSGSGSGSGLAKSSSEPGVVRSGEKVGSKKDTRSKLLGNNTNNKGRVLNLNVNVPMCIGYRHHLSCRSDENSAVGGVGVSSSNKSSSGNGGNNNVANSGNNLFNLRSLFAKKVY